MKYNYFLIFCLLCFCGAAQEVHDGYVQVTLDGKKAYMSIETGEISSSISKKNTLKEASTTNITSGILTHVVQKGETLYAISKKYGMSVTALQNLNELKSTGVTIGQVLHVQSTERKVESTTMYTVEKGDTLYSISKKLSIAISDLKKLNNLNSNNLSIGQQLKTQ